MSERLDLKRVVMKLNGPVEPIGETNADERRLENLEALIELTKDLIDELVDVTQYTRRHEASMKEIGTTATKGLREILLTLQDCEQVTEFRLGKAPSKAAETREEFVEPTKKSRNQRSLDGEIPPLW